MHVAILNRVSDAGRVHAGRDSEPLKYLSMAVDTQTSLIKSNNLVKDANSRKK